MRSFGVALCGASGRMGRSLVERRPAEGAVLTGALVSAGSAAEDRDLGTWHRGEPLGVVCTSDPAVALAEAAVVIDYSSPEGLETLLDALERQPLPLVTGTTGLPPGLQQRIEAYARVAPVLQAANTGVGINVLVQLVHRAAQLLGGDYQAEIMEIHHKRKADAPSGTARYLASAIASAREQSEDVMVCAREGRVGARSSDEIGVFGLRGGDVVGEHTVFFLGDGERIELTHRATDRGTFASGGWRAARWLAQPGRGPGLYGMHQVLAD